MADISGPVTLRKLCAALGEEFMDVPIEIRVSDGTNVEYIPAPVSLSNYPRDTNMPILRIDARLRGTRLVRRAK